MSFYLSLNRKLLMKKINISLIAFFAFLVSIQVYSQEETSLWSGSRPDGHAPIGVMGDHYHKKGELMFSYRWMMMNMDGNLSGTDNIQNEQIFDHYMVAPQSMNMQMHMLGMMYAPSDRVTLMLMANYLQNDMDLKMRMMNGMIMDFSTASSGFGDVKLGVLYKLLNKNRQSLHLNATLSIPTGNIEQKDVTPMSTPNEIQLPYPMQLGSGTVDATIGTTYLGQNESISWGAQPMATFRLNENENDYKLGNQIQLNLWGAYKISNTMSTSLRMQMQSIGEIEGADPNLNPMMVTTADTDNFGGESINLGIGTNFYVRNGVLKGVRVAAEYLMPIHQDLNGIQMKSENSIILGIQYSL